MAVSPQMLHAESIHDVALSGLRGNEKVEQRTVTRRMRPGPRPRGRLPPSYGSCLRVEFATMIDRQKVSRARRLSLRMGGSRDSR